VAWLQSNAGRSGLPGLAHGVVLGGRGSASWPASILIGAAEGGSIFRSCCQLIGVAASQMPW
jgi:hypothetical protein